MKFERLPENELKKLEKEFVQFLVSNTVTAQDWIKLKTNQPNKAEELIDMFSDIVYEKVMSEVEFLEFRTMYDLKSFRCQNEEIIMMGIEVDASLGLDLRKQDDFKKMAQLSNELVDKIKVYAARKPYKPSRSEEIFRMMKSGAQKTNSTMFLLLENLYKKLKEN
ncbi:MAG: hypothetical protein JXQ87_00185 [Bacteroidia bacterium]